MIPQDPEQSGLDHAKAETNGLIQKVQGGLDSLRTAPVNELETRINSLENSFKVIQESAILRLEKAWEFSEPRINALKKSLQSEQERVATLKNEFRIHQEDTKSKYDNTMRELDAARCDRTMAKSALETAKSTLKRTESELEQTETELERTASELGEIETELERTESELEETRTKLEKANGQRQDLRKELEAAKRQNSALVKESVAATPRRLRLEAELKTARLRIGTLESESKTFQDQFSHVNKSVMALASSIKESSHHSLKESRPTIDVDEISDDPRIPGNRVSSEASSPQPADSKRGLENRLVLFKSILEEMMSEKHRRYNQHFLGPAGTASSDLVVEQPMYLGTMKQKLFKGAYSSIDSFRADFELIVENSRTSKPGDDAVRIAGEELLKMFEKIRAASSTFAHEPSDDQAPERDPRVAKRKAEAESPFLPKGGHKKRAALANSRFRRRSHSACEAWYRRAPHLGAASFSPGKNAPKSLGEAGGHCLKHKVTAGRLLNIDVDLETVAKLVSVVKSPKTWDAYWKYLIPLEYRLTSLTVPLTVEQRIKDLDYDTSSDMIVLMLTPASKADKTDFDRIFGYFLNKDRYAIVSHAGIDDVEDIYLIPAPKMACYPVFLAKLDPDLLPPAQTADLLLMVVISGSMTRARKAQIRHAWDGLIETIHNPDNRDFENIPDILLHHPLPAFTMTRRVSGAERHTPMLKNLPRSPPPPGLKISDSARNLLHLTYPDRKPDSLSSIYGVDLPECVFVLGRVISPTRAYGLLVVDIQHRDRPLWMINGHARNKSCLSDTLTLLKKEFPRSLHEWKTKITSSLLEHRGMGHLKSTGLKMARYGTDVAVDN